MHGLHMTDRTPSTERLSRELLDSLRETAAAIAVKGPLLLQLLDEIDAARAQSPEPRGERIGPLPVITVQMLADFGQEGFFEKTEEPVNGVKGVSWSQAAVDFVCLLKQHAPEPEGDYVLLARYWRVFAALKDCAFMALDAQDPASRQKQDNARQLLRELTPETKPEKHPLTTPEPPRCLHEETEETIGGWHKCKCCGLYPVKAGLSVNGATKHE